jgi:hypothetical protein
VWPRRWQPDCIIGTAWRGQKAVPSHLIRQNPA